MKGKPMVRGRCRFRHRPRALASLEPLENRVLFAAGLVAAYGFNEGAGATVADASGNGNTGTISNAGWTAGGKYGAALTFNGVNSWVTINDSASLELTKGMTLEAWVDPTSLNGWEAAVLKERPSGLCYALYTSDNSSRPPAAYINTGANDINATGATNLSLNSWSYLAATYNGSTLSLYVNGVLAKSRSITGSILTSTGALRIGGDSVWGEYFNGTIDEVRVYNVAQTVSQIQADMNTPIGPTVPAVTAETPASGATNVPANTPVTASFNESIQPSTLSFVITDPLNNVIPGSVSYNDTNHTATFTPSVVLQPGLKYTATVSGAQDLSGHPMAAPVSWSFTTIVPAVTGETPAPGATGVALNVAPTVTFNESMQTASIAFTLVDSSNNPVNGTVSYNDATHSAMFTPAAPLASSRTFTATVSGAKDQAGNAIAAPVSWSFTTMAPTLPAVTSESPTINASNVPLNTTVTATFNESIQPATLSFTLVDAANNPVAGAVSYNDATHTATFTPSAVLNAESNYTASVSGARDLNGDAMAAPLTWSFSTVSASPSPLTVVAQYPAPNATGVSIQTAITATFSESIQPSTLNFVLRDQKTNPVAATVSYNDTTKTATLVPTSPLVTGMSYNAIASDAKDLAGNVMDHVSWVFTTQQPGTGPFSIWTPANVPASPNDSDGSSSEVGLKFRTDLPGVITGIRFYKGSQNTGTHTGHLWTIGGTLLASATFTSETASGWQQVNFSAPVAIQANTTYVASYHTTSGHYAEDDNFFTNAGVNSGPLHALQAGVDGFNGVYVDSTSTASFPTLNWLSANYWVDVVFDSNVSLGPSVTSFTPAQGVSNASVNTTATVTFDESVVASSISFVLKDSANNPVAGSVSYDDTSHTATFTPAAALKASTAYTATVSGATDAGGNTLASPVSWSFTTASPAADPSVVGQWSAVQNWPLVALNQILLNNGQVLMYDGGPACIGSSSATVYDPATGTFTNVPVNNSSDDNDIFCSGAVVLADGRVVVIGGHDCTGAKTGIASLNVYDPATKTWTRGPNMAYSRWYPTATLLPDGRVLVTAGADKTDTSLVPIPEVFNPVTNTWSQLTAATQTINNYPFMFVLPDGRVLEAGSDEAPMPTKVLDLSTNTWTVVDPNVVDGSSGVMFRPGMILKAGASCPEEGEVLSQASSANAYVLDMTQASPHWQQVQSMANARTWLDLTMLPDGNVLATGGSRTIGGVDPSTAVFPAEEWNPTSRTWTTLASMATPRMYHSSAILLPDGRVLVAGGGHNYVNNNDYYSAEFYSPSYLFKGTRPTITAVSSTLQYNSTFFVQTPDGASIASVALIHTGAATHAFDEAQNYIPLSFTQSTGGLNVQAPVNANLAPPGYYMLFIVNSNGVPCVAPFVRFPASYEDNIPPTAPVNLMASGSIGSVSLTWGASTDNVGVTGYNVYRSSSSGFTPSPATLVGQTASTTYTDAVPAGTCYYVVEAKDAAGNLSLPSNQVTATATADTIAPSVSMTAPASGATVSGTVSVAAAASDNVGLVGVQFQLDGANLGAELTAAPYTMNWATGSTPNGAHTLTAVARDAAGNKTVSAPVSVTVSNTAVGLVAAYSFDEGSGTTLIDRSGNGNNGTIANATWVAGKYGSALKFNGSNSLVTVANSASLNLTAGMTLEAWVDPTTLTSPDANWAAIIAKEHLNSANDVSYALYGVQGTSAPPGGNVLVGGATYQTTGGSALSLNTWVFLCTTYDGTTLKTYVNGVLVASQTVGGSIFTTGDPLTIGGDWSNEMFNGIIDNVRIYNQALSQSQLQQDMNSAV